MKKINLRCHDGDFRNKAILGIGALRCNQLCSWFWQLMPNAQDKDCEKSWYEQCEITTVPSFVFRSCLLCDGHILALLPNGRAGWYSNGNVNMIKNTTNRICNNRIGSHFSVVNIASTSIQQGSDFCNREFCSDANCIAIQSTFPVVAV